MYLDPAEWAQQEILIKGATEPLTLRLINEIVVSNSCVIDVGAHVGHHALQAAKAAGLSGRIFAFDPQPYNADRIGRHAVLYGLTNIVTICAAVGEKDGFVKLPMQSARDRSRLSLLESGSNNENGFVEVPMRRLDTFIAAHAIETIQLLKIDVEGYELEVLGGLDGKLPNCHSIILELLDTTSAARNRSVVDVLTAGGFELKDVTGNACQWGMPLPESNLWAAQH